MADPADYETASSGLPAAEDNSDSLIGRVKDLVDDARTAAEAEIAWQSARAGFVGRRAAFIAAWGGFALVCAFVAVLALAFGAILALTPLIGAILATAVVTGVLLLAAVIAGLIARSRVRQLKAAAFPIKPGARP